MKKLLAVCCLLISCATTSVTSTVKEAESRKVLGAFSVRDDPAWKEFYGDISNFSPKHARSFAFADDTNGSLAVVSIFFNGPRPTEILETMMSVIAIQEDQFVVVDEVSLIPEIVDGVGVGVLQLDPPVMLRFASVTNGKQTALIQIFMPPSEAAKKSASSFLSGFEISK